MSEEEKAKLKSKPISSTAVPGTPWCVVWTRDKRVFFYNPSEKISLWERPQILTGRVDVDKLVKEPPAQLLDSSSTTTSATTSSNNSNAKKKSVAPTETNTAEQPAVKKHKIQVDEENSRVNSVSPKSGGSNSPKNDRSMSPNPAAAQAAASEFLQKDKIEASKEAAIEAEHQAAQVRAQLPLEQRMQQFKDMLVEKQVSAYSTWEKELQKIVFDPRYLLLSSKERKQVFEKYVKDRANQESKEKAAVLKRKKESFNDLLKEAGVNLKTNISFSEFAARYAKDERFKAIEKTKDRESLFNDYLSDLRKIEKEEKYAEKEKLKKAYIAMLKEMKSLHRSSSWTETKKLIENDPRYKAIDSSTKREDYFRDHCKYLDDKPTSNGDSASKSKDKEHKSEKRHKYDKEKSDKKDESESKMDMEGSDEGETLEKSSDMNDESNDEEMRKEKEKQDRIEASLRERNKEVKKIKEEYNSEREKERDLLRHDEAVEAFKVNLKLVSIKTLLLDL